jgi:hypothetical protein
VTNLTYPLGLIGASLAVLWWRCAAENALERRLGDAIREGMERGRATLTGDPTGEYALDATLDGERVRLERTTVRPPGPGEQGTVAVTRVTVSTDAELTLLVCRRSDEATLMGPVPAVPRTPTGDSSFDAAFGCYLTPIAAAEGYRDPSRTRVLGWAMPAVLTPLQALGLRWMHAREGVLHLAFELLSADDAWRAMEVGANVARALRGEGVRAVTSAPRSDEAPERVVPRAKRSRLAALLGGVLGGTPLGICLAFSGLLHPVFEAEVCGPGAHLQTTMHDGEGGTSYGMICAGASEVDADGFLFRCVVFAAAIIIAGAAMNSLRPIRTTRS